MADNILRIFKNRKVNVSKLVLFGFEQGNDDCYRYSKDLPTIGFRFTVCITPQGEISTEMMDPSFHEPYTLHLADGASGSFIGEIKSQYEEILTEISEQCFEWDVFKSKQAKALMDYVRRTYEDELEFLWKKFPENAIWRRKDTQKWYGALLTVSKRKLGVKCDEVTEILDFRVQPEVLETLIDNNVYFPGYHMNKKHWCTVVLDNSVPFDEICQRIDQSYLLAV